MELNSKEAGEPENAQLLFFLLSFVESYLFSKIMCIVLFLGILNYPPHQVLQ